METLPDLSGTSKQRFKTHGSARGCGEALGVLPAVAAPGGLLLLLLLPRGPGCPQKELCDLGAGVHSALLCLRSWGSPQDLGEKKASTDGGLNPPILAPCLWGVERPVRVTRLDCPTPVPPAQGPAAEAWHGEQGTGPLETPGGERPSGQSLSWQGALGAPRRTPGPRRRPGASR